jgi:transcriptional regulator with GAF, ATPase, and Fis domain
MKSTAVWDSEAVEPSNESGSGKENQTSAGNNIMALRELTLKLMREVQSITEVRTLPIENGLDFYDEVSRFEIDLIKRALVQTAGHQGRAARLLNLKVTTLNSKIKHYNISLNGFSNGYALMEQGEIEARQHA